MAALTFDSVLSFCGVVEVHAVLLFDCVVQSGGLLVSDGELTFLLLQLHVWHNRQNQM